jgi:hypothetical protein
MATGKQVHGITLVGVSADKTMTIHAVGNLTIHPSPPGQVPVPPDMPPPVVDNTLPAPPPTQPPDSSLPEGPKPTPHR